MPITPLDLQQNDKQLKGRLLDGQLDGALHIKDDGRAQADLHYSQGELQGTTLLYHPNGKVSAQLPFVRDKLQGIASFFMRRKAGCSARRLTAEGCCMARRSITFPMGNWRRPSSTAMACARAGISAFIPTANPPSRLDISMVSCWSRNRVLLPMVDRWIPRASRFRGCAGGSGAGVIPSRPEIALFPASASCRKKPRRMRSPVGAAAGCDLLILFF